MKRQTTLIAGVLAALLAIPAMAQDFDTRFADRNVNQQERILEGLQNGRLTVQEAGHLQRQAARLERLQRNAWRGGISRQDRQAIRQGLRQLSMQIRDEMTDAQTAPRRTASHDRMTRLVQRNVNQNRRIAQGLRSGELTTREAARLIAGEARIHRRQADAAADGFIDRGEMIAIRDLERLQSDRIFQQKHDSQEQSG